MAEIFIVKEGLYLWAENCPQCGNDEYLLGVELNGVEMFLAKCLDCCQIIGLCTLKGSELCYIVWGSEDDVLKALDGAHSARKLLVKISYRDNFSSNDS